MILGIGIDSVDIARFEQWHTYSHKKLLRVFSPAEIAYSLENPTKSAERFAVRFAAKEALFKALNSSPSIHSPEVNTQGVRGLLHIMRLCELTKPATLNVNWQALGLPKLQALVSVTHSQITASAIVILQKP